MEDTEDEVVYVREILKLLELLVGGRRNVMHEDAIMGQFGWQVIRLVHRVPDVSKSGITT